MVLRFLYLNYILHALLCKLTLTQPVFTLKMSPYYFHYIILNAIQTAFSRKQSVLHRSSSYHNPVAPQLTCGMMSSYGVVLPGSMLFEIQATKVSEQITKQTIFVVNSGKLFK